MRTARFCGTTGYGPRKDTVGESTVPVGVQSRGGMVPGGYGPRGYSPRGYDFRVMVQGQYGHRRVWCH